MPIGVDAPNIRTAVSNRGHCVVDGRLSEAVDLPDALPGHSLDYATLNSHDDQAALGIREGHQRLAECLCAYAGALLFVPLILDCLGYELPALRYWRAEHGVDPIGSHAPTIKFYMYGSLVSGRWPLSASAGSAVLAAHENCGAAAESV